MENMNDAKYLNEHLETLLRQLEMLEAVPGLQIESAEKPKVMMERGVECRRLIG